jgi:hypothetical protein
MHRLMAIYILSLLSLQININRHLSVSLVAVLNIKILDVVVIHEATTAMLVVEDQLADVESVPPRA